jgi:MFS family permease
MAPRNEVAAVYTAGVVQGLALVTFPSASTIFTSPQYYGLSSTAYGAMFLPQAIMAIAASLLGGKLTHRLGIKRVYLIGLFADLLSMGLLFSSQFVMENTPAAYGMLLLATTCLGTGFGLTVPALNTLTAGFFPQKIDSAVLILNALLGVGTVLAPVLAAVFTGLGIWWGLPLSAGLLLSGLLLFSLNLPLKVEGIGGSKAGPGERNPLPRRFWVFAAFALLYGIAETMNGNWASIYMSQDVGASTAAASLALTAFWGMVTVGRVLFAAIAKRFPANRTYRLLPFILAAAFVIIALIPEGNASLGVLAFGLAGLGCSALLPLTISFGQEELVVIATTIAGGLIAFYQMGYGIAAFGVGPLEEYSGLSLTNLYGIAAVVALFLAGLSFRITRQKPAGPAGQIQRP